MSIKINKVVIGEGMPKICVPLAGRSRGEILLQAQEAAAAEPDLVEWRVDFWKEISDAEAFNKTAETLGEILGEIPLLFTFRTADEGGEQFASAKLYQRLNLMASKRPEMSLVDVEICKADMNSEETAALIEEIQKAGKTVVASNHHFTETPSDEEMYRTFESMAAAGADIWKLAVMPETPEDVLRLLAVTRKVSMNTTHPVITMSMGKQGVISRLSGELFGSAVTFASVSEASAPGQVEIEKLREALLLFRQ